MCLVAWSSNVLWYAVLFFSSFTKRSYWIWWMLIWHGICLQFYKDVLLRIGSSSSCAWIGECCDERLAGYFWTVGWRDGLSNNCVRKFDTLGNINREFTSFYMCNSLWTCVIKHVSYFQFPIIYISNSFKPAIMRNGWEMNEYRYRTNQSKTSYIHEL